jgi:hypothetical protein
MSLAGVMRHLAFLFTLPVSGLAGTSGFFFSLLSLLKGGKEEAEATNADSVSC